MNCPKCEGTALNSVTMSIEDRGRPGTQALALELDECPDCAGIWFDPGELDKYLGAKIKLPAVPTAAKKTAAQRDAETGSCPRCAVALEHRPGQYNPGVVVDVCAKCGGTWVDGEELNKAGGDDLPFADKMKALFGDVKPGGR